MDVVNKDVLFTMMIWSLVSLDTDSVVFGIPLSNNLNNTMDQ